MLPRAVTRVGLLATFDSPIEDKQRKRNRTGERILFSRDYGYNRSQQPQGNLKRKAIGKRGILKEERTTERKTKRNLKKRMIKTTIWRVVLYESKRFFSLTMRKRGYKMMRLLKYGHGEEWSKSAGWNIKQMKKCWK